MNDILACTVTHHGVPIGTVDLELLGAQGLGTLTPLPAYRSVRPWIRLAGALGANARIELLTRRADDIPSHPMIARATLALELVDLHGVAIPVDAIRLVELRTRPGVTVLVDMRSDPVGKLALVPQPLLSSGDQVLHDHTESTT